MGQILNEMPDKLDRITRDAKIIKWLSVICIIVWILIPIVLLYFLIYIFKLSNLKNNQSLSGLFNKLNGKTTKELKSIQKQNEPIEQGIAGLLLAHKSMVTVLIVIGTIITISLGVIIISHLLGLEMV